MYKKLTERILMAGRLRPFRKMAILRTKFHAKKQGWMKYKKLSYVVWPIKKNRRLHGRTGQKFILRIVVGHHNFTKKGSKSGLLKIFGTILGFYTKLRFRQSF